MIFSGGVAEGARLWTAEVLIFFRISFTGSVECREDSFLQYMGATCLKDMNDMTIGCVCLLWSTNYDWDRKLRQAIWAWEKGRLSVASVLE